MSSANLAAAAAYKNSVHELGPDFIYKAFYAFKTMLHATVAEGNKGKRTLTEIMVGDLVYAWNKNFNPRQNAIDYRPREIEVVAQKFDLAFVPQEYEATYLGAARKKGQNPGSDLPAEAEHMMLIMAKIASELENAVWRGQITAVGTVVPNKITSSRSRQIQSISSANIGISSYRNLRQRQYIYSYIFKCFTLIYICQSNAVSSRSNDIRNNQIKIGAAVIP